MSSKPSVGKTEAKTGGMKPSVSAPSSFPSVKTAQKDSLFDHGNDDDDLFAATKELRYYTVAFSLFPMMKSGRGQWISLCLFKKLH